MGRPRSFDDVEALEAAMKVFWSKGYGATSIDDLEEAMELRRTSIYNAYGKKRELFVAALQHYSDRVLARLIDRLNSHDDVRKGIRNLMRDALEGHFDPDTPGGCLIQLTAHESEQHDVETHRIVGAFFRRLDREIEHYIKRGKDRGDVSSTLDEKTLAAVVSSMMPGLITRARGNAPAAVLNRAIDGVMQLV